MGLSGTRKTMTAWNERAKSWGLGIRRDEMSLSELALLTLEERRSWSCQQPPGGGAEPLRWSGDQRPQPQAGTQGISVRDKEKLFSP